MALSNAEKVQRYRERKKAALKKAPDAADSYLKRPFSEFMGDRWSDVTLYLDWIGVKEIPDYEADGDTDPDHNPDTDGPYRASIGRAERMVDMLLDAALELAIWINRYKKEEIDARIAELEAADLSDPDAKRQALTDIVRLSDIRKQLDRDTRRVLPVYRLKEEEKPRK